MEEELGALLEYRLGEQAHACEICRVCNQQLGCDPEHLPSTQAAGESAEEELGALLEESGASMHTQKESRAEKAAWWRTRIALDARLQHLCACLQTRLGPWL